MQGPSRSESVQQTSDLWSTEAKISIEMQNKSSESQLDVELAKWKAAEMFKVKKQLP